MKWPLIGLVLFYRWVISPMLGPPRCRYYPSCSEYALIALKHYGAIKGCQLTIKRILRCHPGCEGGIDPVPGVPLESTSPEKKSPEINNSKEDNNDDR